MAQFDLNRPSRPHQWVIGSARKRPFASGSPLCGNRRLGQFVEQRLGVLEVGGVEAFGEPGEDRGKEGHRLLRPACCWRRRARLIAPRNSQDFAFCRRATSMDCCMAVSASLTVPAPASKASLVGGSRWLVAKDVNERSPTQRYREGKRVPERLGVSYRCNEFFQGPIRVAEHPGNQRQVNLA